MNDTNVNLASLDYPDVSSMGRETTPIPYQYYGNRDNDNWDLWYLRARINEQTLDFWWVKNMYYWDRPQQFIACLFVIDVALTCGAGWLVYKKYRTMDA
jgi:hypothetical protein